jgi:hypothetical protein
MKHKLEPGDLCELLINGKQQLVLLLEPPPGKVGLLAGNEVFGTTIYKNGWLAMRIDPVTFKPLGRILVSETDIRHVFVAGEQK